MTKNYVFSRIAGPCWHFRNNRFEC